MATLHGHIAWPHCMATLHGHIVREIPDMCKKTGVTVIIILDATMTYGKETVGMMGVLHVQILVVRRHGAIHADYVYFDRAAGVILAIC